MPCIAIIFVSAAPSPFSVTSMGMAAGMSSSVASGSWALGASPPSTGEGWTLGSVSYTHLGHLGQEIFHANDGSMLSQIVNALHHQA